MAASVAGRIDLVCVRHVLTTLHSMICTPRLVCGDASARDASARLRASAAYSSRAWAACSSLRAVLLNQPRKGRDSLVHAAPSQKRCWVESFGSVYQPALGERSSGIRTPIVAPGSDIGSMSTRPIQETPSGSRAVVPWLIQVTTFINLSMSTRPIQETPSGSRAVVPWLIQVTTFINLKTITGQQIRRGGDGRRACGHPRARAAVRVAVRVAVPETDRYSWGLNP